MTAMSSAVSAASDVEGESLSERCERLREEWAAAEWQRMSEDYHSSAGVDAVTGALGPLYFAKVTIESTPIVGMIDPGLSATIISFDLFRKVGGGSSHSQQCTGSATCHVKGLQSESNSQLNLTFRWEDKTVTTPVYIRSDQAAKGEHCLLGTNIVMPLGLMVPSEGVEARGGQSASLPVAPPTVTTTNSARVCLVGVQRVPSRCATVVTAKLQEPVTEGPSVLFEPDKKWTGGGGERYGMKIHLSSLIVRVK